MVTPDRAFDMRMVASIVSTADFCVVRDSSMCRVRKCAGVVLWIVGLLVAPCGVISAAPQLPNIVYMLADDMGMGDVRSYSPTSPVNTPNIDRIATAGMRFTDAHSSDSVCTPTRYSILTGQYAWRGAYTGTGVLVPFSTSIIDTNRLTVADMLKSSGYDTGAFGKWHLGANWQTNGGAPANTQGSNINFNLQFTNGPLAQGFDTYFGVEGSPNFPPYGFVRDNRLVDTVNSGTMQVHGGTVPVLPSSFGQGTPFTAANWYGPQVSTYNIKDATPAITNEATAYISSKAGGPKPFFTYIPFPGVHEPINPPDFATGQSGVTGSKAAYGDFVWTVDWAVGQVLDTLNDPNHDGNTSDSILNNTLVIFGSDNGASTFLGFGSSPGKVNGVSVRDNKASIYEGGARIPFIAQWPGHVPSGTTNSHPVDENDFMATVAGIIGYNLPSNAAEDSVNISSELLATSPIPSRSVSIQRSTDTSRAIRQVDTAGTEWKLIFTNGDGVSTGTPVDPMAPLTDFTKVQLYNLTTDPGESINLLSGGGNATMQQKALQLQLIMENFIATGRSANIPGDYNGDRMVNASDYIVWRNALGTVGTSAADGNYDGVVDSGDYILWRKALAASGSGSGGLLGEFGSNVPEPSSFLLVATSLCCLIAHSARRRRAC
jgi:arylsulfatase A